MKLVLALLPLHHLPPVLLLLFQLFLWCFLPSCIKVILNYFIILLSELQSMKSEKFFSKSYSPFSGNRPRSNFRALKSPALHKVSITKTRAKCSIPYAAELKCSSMLYFVNKEQHHFKTVPLHPTLLCYLTQIYRYTTVRTKEHQEICSSIINTK